MDDFRIPLGDWVEGGVDYVIDNFRGFFQVLRTIFVGMFDGVAWLLTAPPFWAVIIVAALIALVARGGLFALGTAAALALVVGMDQ